MPEYSPIMVALCSMLLVTYYASNYAGIIGLGLVNGVVIPKVASWEKVVEALCVTHPRIVKMKSLACNYMHAKSDKQLELRVRS